jgi:hypothetical protein
VLIFSYILISMCGTYRLLMWSYRALWKRIGVALSAYAVHTRAVYTHRIFQSGSIQTLKKKKADSVAG